jgi:hypothetical protein
MMGLAKVGFDSREVVGEFLEWRDEESRASVAVGYRR